MQDGRYTITEVREVQEFEGKRGTGYSFYCVVTDEEGTDFDVKINAKSSNRWKAGMDVEIEVPGYDAWEYDGVEYEPVKASIPEDQRKGGGGRGRGSSNTGNRGRQQETRSTTNGSKPAAKTAPAASFEDAVVLANKVYGAVATVLKPEAAAAVTGALVLSILTGRVEAPKAPAKPKAEEKAAETTEEESDDVPF